MPLNLQDKGDGKRGIEYVHYTWNFLTGCKFKCRWIMDDGTITRCYAEALTETFAKHAFDQPEIHPDRLEEPIKFKKSSRIFLDSMADLLGPWNDDAIVNAVFDTCRKAHWHQFLLLTKNYRRLEHFKIPSNVWAGVSAPPSFMNGKGEPGETDASGRCIDGQLSLLQQIAYTQGAMKMFTNLKATVRWMSIEPLSFDIAPYLVQDGPIVSGKEVRPPLDWVVIGAASNGSQISQPKADWVRNVTRLMDHWGIPVFFKGNLKGNEAAEVWREELPQQGSKETSQIFSQGTLF